MSADREEVEARVRKTFDEVASRYDHPGASWFDLTARELVRAAQLKPGMSALDLATGTGKVALGLAASEPGAQVVGVDLSEGMIEEAQRKAQQLELRNVEFHASSFDTLSYGPRFDLVCCSFGVFFVSHMAEALARFAQQTKVGGRLLLSTFLEGSFSPWSDLFMRLYGSYGFETPPPPWLRIGTRAGFAQLFAEAGLPEPEIREHDFSFDLPDAEAWWQIVNNAGYRGMLQRLRPEDLASFRAQHLSDTVDRIEKHGQRRLEVRVLIAEVTRR